MKYTINNEKNMPQPQKNAENITYLFDLLR